MADLSNGANWLKIYDQFIVAQAVPNKPGKFYPIQGVIVPAVLDVHTIAVLSSTTNPRPSWDLGAKVFQIITVLGSDIGNARNRRNDYVELNQSTIIRLQRISTYYRVGVKIPAWFPDVHLQVWTFTGIEDIQTIDEKIDHLQADLTRIEGKIDATYPA